MAISKEITKNIYGKELIFENAYIKINQLTGDKNNLEMQVGTYNNAEKQSCIEERVYNFIPSVEDTAPNFIKQGYEYLKTLPEYQDAIDC